MCLMFKLSIYLILFFVLTGHSTSGAKVKHECKTKDAALKLNSIKIDRLLINNDLIHIFTDDNEVISTKIPHFHVEDDRKHLIYGQSYVQKYEKAHLEGLKFIGLIRRNKVDKSSVYEFFKTTNGTFKALELKFDKIPGEYGADVFSEFNYNFLQFMLKNILFFHLEEVNFNRTIEYNEIKGVVKRRIKFRTIQGSVRQTIVMDYNVTHSVFYEGEKIKSTIIEIDNKNNIYIHLIDESSDENKNLVHVLRLPELLNCRLISNSYNVKGIVYMNSIFFIFINHFYIQTSYKNLIENEFVINEQMFKNATDLDLGDNFKYENKFSTWIKTYANTSYLAIMDQIFELSVNPSKQDLVMTKIYDHDYLKFCLKQTLNVNNYVFCFEENNYYLFYVFESPEVLKNDKNITISSLFKEKNVIYEKDQKLLFIFKHEDEYVFMTKVNLFIIKQNQFVVDKNLNLILNGEVKKLKNSFFDKMPVVEPTELPSTQKPESNVNRAITLIQIFFIVLIVVACAILSIYLVCKNAKPKNAKSSTDIPLQVKIRKKDNDSLTNQMSKSKNSIAEIRSKSKSLSDKNSVSSMTESKSKSMVSDNQTKSNLKFQSKSKIESTKSAPIKDDKNDKVKNDSESNKPKM